MTKDKPKLTSIKMTGPISPVARLVSPVARLVSAARVTHSPSDWRLARRNGELILQCGSIWNQGNDFGIEWKDLPTVDMDELEALPND